MGLFDKVFNRNVKSKEDDILRFGAIAISALQRMEYKLAANSFQSYFDIKGEGLYLNIDSDDYMMLYNFSIAKFNIGDINGAIVQVTKAIEKQPFFAAFKERAMYYNEVKEFDKAIADYTKCAQLKPEEKSYYICERGIAYYNSGNPNLAIPDFVTAYELGNVRAGTILREQTNYFE